MTKYIIFGILAIGLMIGLWTVFTPPVSASQQFKPCIWPNCS